MKTTLISTLVLSFCFNFIIAQDCDELIDNLNWNIEVIPQGPLQTGDQFFIEFHVTQFIDIIAFQYTLQFDSEILEFISIDNLGSELVGPVVVNDVQSSISNGNIPTIWTNGNGEPQTIQDGPIFKMFFEVIGNPTECFEWDINSAIVEPEIAFELGGIEDCTTDMINYNFSPAELCVDCQDLYVAHSSCAETIEFFACGGIEPYTYTLEGPSGVVGNGTLTSMDTIRIDNLVDGLYFIILEDNLGFTIPISNSAIEVISTNTEVTITNNTVIVCNDNGTSFPNTLDLSDNIISNRPYSIIDPNGEILNSSIVNFLGQETGTYEYTYIVEGPYPCEDEIYTLIIDVLDCACPILGLTPIGDHCNNVILPLNLNQFLIAGTEPGTFSLLDENGELYFIQPAIDGLLPTSNLNDGIYTLVYTLTMPEIACAESVQETITIVDGPQEISTINPPTDLCNTDTLGNVSILDLNTLVSASGIWTDEQGNTVENGIVDFNGTIAGIVSFIFTTDTAVQPCENISVDIAFEVMDCIPTSVNITSSESISIYPNPTSDVFNIDIESAAKASVYDLNGEIRRELSLSQGQNKVQLDELESGLYFLLISREGRIVDQQKLIVD